MMPTRSCFMCCARPGIAPAPAGAAGSAREGEAVRVSRFRGSPAGRVTPKPAVWVVPAYLAVEVSAHGFLRPRLVIEFSSSLFLGVSNHVGHHLRQNQNPSSLSLFCHGGKHSHSLPAPCTGCPSTAASALCLPPILHLDALATHSTSRQIKLVRSGSTVHPPSTCGSP